MTREELKEHCKKQIESCEMWAEAKGEEPSGRVYEEHKLTLELLEQETVSRESYEHEYFLRKELEAKIAKLERQPSDDCIARQPLIDNWNSCADMLVNEGNAEVVMGWIFDAPSVTPAHKKGQWLRMSDLSEQEDDRYQCSYCRNVVHYKNKMDLYTFNGWCGRCGSSNRREIEVEL